MTKYFLLFFEFFEPPTLLAGFVIAVMTIKNTPCVPVDSINWRGSLLLKNGEGV
jgi:hypothetical protein